MTRSRTASPASAIHTRPARAPSSRVGASPICVSRTCVGRIGAGFVASAAIAVFAGCAPGSDGARGSDGAPAPPTSLATAADSLLARSIAFHDPDGVWGARPLELTWSGTDGRDSARVAGTITIDPTTDSFAFSGEYGGHRLDYAMADGAARGTVDGVEPDSAMRAQMRLDREGGRFWRDYYEFLAGLPMKLRDPGTRVGGAVERRDFAGHERDVIRVTYDATTGGDTWYFYFDPDTAELVGGRFYHDESAGDGEYLVFEGVTEGALRIPRVRRWYVNADSTYLGMDEIRSVSVSGGVSPP